MVITSRVGRRGQITLPKPVRQLLGVEEGDRVAFLRQGKVVVIQPLSLTLRDVRGKVAVSGRQDFEAVRDAVRIMRAMREQAAEGSGGS